MVSVRRVYKPAEIEACYRIRVAVFVEEQQVPLGMEIDENDASCAHYLAYADQIPVGTGRVIYGREGAAIGRLAVMGAYRKQGVGALLMRHMLADIALSPVAWVKLGAQCSAAGFYEKLGFAVCGEIYDDVGIEHIPMRLRLPIQVAS